MYYGQMMILAEVCDGMEGMNAEVAYMSDEWAYKSEGLVGMN